MNEIRYCIENLKELISLARKADKPMLVYLLEMALAEAYEEIGRKQ